MHETLKELQTELTQVVAKVKAVVPSGQPFGIAQNNWSFPGLTRDDLVSEVQSLTDLIDTHGNDTLGDSEIVLQDYVRRIRFLHENTVPNIWNSPVPGVSTYFLTIQALRRVLTAALVRDDYGDAVAKLSKLTSQIRSMEARLRDLDPRTTSIATMVSRIENAHAAADQLPTDIASLAEAREKLQKLVEGATKDHGHIENLRSRADSLDERLRQSTADAKSVLERCETAYSAATSVGLAAAFTERSNNLSSSMWIWVGGLVLALISGSYFGSSQLHTPPRQNSCRIDRTQRGDEDEEKKWRDTARNTRTGWWQDCCRRRVHRWRGCRQRLA